MSNEKPSWLNTICFAIVIVIAVFAATAVVNGQETKPDTQVDANGALRAGEGFAVLVPTWFCLLKVEADHFTDRGSACFIESRIVLTCWHNLRDVSKGKLVLIDGFGNRYEDIEILQTSPKLDLALLKINDKEMPYHTYLPVSNNDFKPEGTVHAVGLVPATESIERHEGKLNGRVYGAKGMKEVFWGHTAKVVQGMSGGPLVNDEGEVVGVNVSNGEDDSQSVTLKRIQWFLDQYKGNIEEE